MNPAIITKHQVEFFENEFGMCSTMSKMLKKVETYEEIEIKNDALNYLKKTPEVLLHLERCFPCYLKYSEIMPKEEKEAGDSN